MFLKLGTLFFLAAVVLWLWAIFDSLTAESSRVRNLPKVVWVILVLLFFWVGALAWTFFGRPSSTSPRTPVPPAAGTDERGFGRTGRGPRGSGGSTQAPRGPDDDPDFLRGL